jgi:hypothetical protein
VLLDLIRELHRRDALRRFGLAGHLSERAAARGTLALVRRQLVPNLDRGERRLRTGAMARLWRARAGRGLGAARVTLKHLCARVLKLLQERQLELLDIRRATQPGELRRQLTDFVNEALILAIEEETDLTQRVEIVFVFQLHHSPRI